jgi:hypothetical protein
MEIDFMSQVRGLIASPWTEKMRSRRACGSPK